MATEVVMPQMGESVAEGTIVRWLKNVGDAVERDEPLFEISTDKVDAEIPSPAAGVVAAIHHREGETVPINTVVAVIGPAGTAVATAPPAKGAPPASAPAPDPSPVARAAVPTAAPGGSAPSPAADGDTGTTDANAAGDSPAAAAAPAGAEEGQRLSPVVKKIAQEHNVDVSQLRGSGAGGRVTKQDILAFLGQRPTAAVSDAGTAPPSLPRAAAPPPPAASKPQPAPGTTVPMSVMRKKIAEHMVASRRTSAHVHSVFEVNCHRIDQIRKAKKDEFERAGAKLTYLSFIIKATVDALRAVPVVNASLDGDNVLYHKDVNVGIAVALDWGLIVPVIKKADEKNLLGLSRSVADLAARARSKKLAPDEVQGGTFTITNPGVFGAQFGMPIINQPQVAILGVGVVEKRAVVIDDAIAIRPMVYLSLGYDHRLIDGAVADEFLSKIKRTLENWDPQAV
jgi:2-oxoglutarate dehydrogenase E2 component (dihydrolipoamide succinyltransferase)